MGAGMDVEVGAAEGVRAVDDTSSGGAAGGGTIATVVPVRASAAMTLFKGGSRVESAYRVSRPALGGTSRGTFYL